MAVWCSLTWCCLITTVCVDTRVSQWHAACSAALTTLLYTVKHTSCIYCFTHSHNNTIISFTITSQYLVFDLCFNSILTSALDEVETQTTLSGNTDNFKWKWEISLIWWSKWVDTGLKPEWNWSDGCEDSPKQSTSALIEHSKVYETNQKKGK